MKCSFCQNVRDSDRHLLFECEFSKATWKDIQKMTNVNHLPDSWEEVIHALCKMKNNNFIWSIVRRITLRSTVYCIWNERNAKLFRGEKWGIEAVGKIIRENIRFRLMSLIVKNSDAFLQVEKTWNVQLKKIGYNDKSK
ncbi:hypothetical protein Tco_0712917 [Tanacetum coccineum]